MLGSFDPHNVTGKYVLNEEGDPVEERDLFAWAAWYETADRRVLRTQVGVAQVSTIFLALDHDHFRLLGGERTPILWETMVFGGAFTGWQRRDTSKLDALASHVRVCELVERFDVRATPRRLKKALCKVAAQRPLRRRERHRVRQWAAKVSAWMRAA